MPTKDNTEFSMMYYVCRDCAAFEMGPTPGPMRCETCGAHHSSLDAFMTLENAEEYSQSILDQENEVV